MSQHDHREADHRPSTGQRRPLGAPAADVESGPGPREGLLTLSYLNRLALAKSECAMVFEFSRGEITERQVFDVVEHWTIDRRGSGSRADRSLLAGQLLAWVG